MPNLTADAFFDDLRALRNKYPMCYLQAITPGDMQWEWDDPKCVTLVRQLHRNDHTGVSQDDALRYAKAEVYRCTGRP